MSTYLIICGTVGLLLAICSVALAVDAADRQIARRRRMSELQRQTRAAWERTLQQLQTESSERQHGKARRAFR